MSTLRDLIDDGRVHVLDGAMGTMLYSRGMFVNVCYDELNLSQPALVQDVHEAYVQAGAEILETNTFGANPVKLSSHGWEDETEVINRSAVAIARRAANGRALVIGAIGPLGIRLEPWGPTAREEAIGFFSRQARGLLEGEVDGFILETFGDLHELEAALCAVKGLTDLPVIAQMTVGQDGNTAYGTSVEIIAARLTELGADVIGLNCSVGPAAMLDAIERMVERTDRPISAQPNAGLPRAVDDRRIYLASPEYMGSYARRMIQAGARFVGGCCGTTPEHIKQIHAYVASVQPRLVPMGPPAAAAGAATGVEPVPLAHRSRLGQRLGAGEFVTSVEILPPKGWNPAEMLEQCRALQQAGVNAVNVLVVTGDPPTMGPYPDSTAVFDIDSIGLTNLLHRLNQGLDPGGNSIGEPTRFVVGVAVNQGADLGKELERFAWKVEAGADFAVTQPVFDTDQLKRFLDRARPRVPVIAGIWPLTSLRNAEFLANEVPGVHLPPTVVERMRRAQEQGTAAARAEGVALASEMIEAVKGLVQGVQVSAPAGRVAGALEVLASL